MTRHDGDSGKNTRRGPRPLHAHIGMAAGLGASAQNIESLLRGIQAYQLHPYKRSMPELPTLWQKGEACLSVTGKNFPSGRRPVVLLVPSMVNRAYIYDLMPERSLLRWLDGQGIDAVLFDWGEPMRDPAQQTIEGAVVGRLMPAARHLKDMGGAPVAALGYCMGGTLLAGAAALDSSLFAALAFLAAPWDFAAAAPGGLRDRVRFWAPSAAAQIVARGFLPVDWVQSVFASLNPHNTLQKFSKFAAMDPASSAAALFVAVEDWLNDGIDLPAALAREVIDGWFLGNATGEGRWQIQGRSVDPSRIDVPAMVIASRRDNLVAYESAASLQQTIPGATLHNPECGHIGMIAGAQAVEQVWAPLAAWLRAQCGTAESF